MVFEKKRFFFASQGGDLILKGDISTDVNLADKYKSKKNNVSL